MIAKKAEKKQTRDLAKQALKTQALSEEFENFGEVIRAFQGKKRASPLKKLRSVQKRDARVQASVRVRADKRQQAAARKTAKRILGLGLDNAMMRMAKAAARSSWKAEFLPKGSWLAWLQRQGGGWGGCAVLPVKRIGDDGRATIAVSLACSPGRPVARLKRFVEELQMLAACDIVPRLLTARVGDLRVDWIQDQAPESMRSLQELGKAVGPEAWGQLAYETGRQLAGAADLGVALLHLSAEKIHCTFDAATGRFDVRLCAFSPDDLRHAREERDLLVQEGGWHLSLDLLQALRCTYVGAAVALLAAGADAAVADAAAAADAADAASAAADDAAAAAVDAADAADAAAVAAAVAAAGAAVDAAEAAVHAAKTAAADAAALADWGWRAAIRDVARTVSFLPAGLNAETLLRCSLFRTLADRYVAATKYVGGRVAALQTLLNYADRDLQMPRYQASGTPPPRCLGRLYNSFGASAHSSEGARTLASRASLFGLRTALMAPAPATKMKLLLPQPQALQRNDYVKQEPQDMRARYETRRKTWRIDWGSRGDAALALRPAKGVTAEVILRMPPLESCEKGAAYSNSDQVYFALQLLNRGGGGVEEVEATRGGSLAVALLRSVQEDPREPLALQRHYRRRSRLSLTFAAGGGGEGSEGLPSDLCAALRRFENPTRRPSARLEDRLLVVCADRARQCTIVDAEGDEAVRQGYILKAPGGRYFPLELLETERDVRHPQAHPAAVLSALRAGLRGGGGAAAAGDDVQRMLGELQELMENILGAEAADAARGAAGTAALRSTAAAAAVEDPVDAQRAALLVHSITMLREGRASAANLKELLTGAPLGEDDGEVDKALELARRRAELLYLRRTVGGEDVEACWYALELWRLEALTRRISLFRR
jgi:hypothetical protein